MRHIALIATLVALALTRTWVFKQKSLVDVDQRPRHRSMALAVAWTKQRVRRSNSWAKSQIVTVTQFLAKMTHGHTGSAGDGIGTSLISRVMPGQVTGSRNGAICVPMRA